MVEITEFERWSEKKCTSDMQSDRAVLSLAAPSSDLHHHKLVLFRSYSIFFVCCCVLYSFFFFFFRVTRSIKASNSRRSGTESRCSSTTSDSRLPLSLSVGGEFPSALPPRAFIITLPVSESNHSSLAHSLHHSCQPQNYQPLSGYSKPAKHAWQRVGHQTVYRHPRWAWCPYLGSHGVQVGIVRGGQGGSARTGGVGDQVSK